MAQNVQYQAEIFYNRLSKKYRELRKWARKNRISCYRVFDKDIPEIPLAVDIYEFLPDDIRSTVECAKFIGEQNQRISSNDPFVEKEAAMRRFALVFMYERPYRKDKGEEQVWLSVMQQQVSKVFSIPENHVILKERKKQKGENQYEKSFETGSLRGLVQEQGQIFNVDLSTYLDTFLFFDHRPLRSFIRNNASGKRVLNLFCYTGTFSVYAASGNAKFVESVDLSNTYLNVAKENFLLNGLCDKSKYVFTRSDVFAFLDEKIKEIEKKGAENKKSIGYDLIILDPPTFSNSKMSRNMLDINRQWPVLVNKCISLLNDNGVLYFSTNSRRLSFDVSYVVQAMNGGHEVTVCDITSKTIPEDFIHSKSHRCWKICLTDRLCNKKDGYVEKSIESNYSASQKIEKRSLGAKKRFSEDFDVRDRI